MGLSAKVVAATPTREQARIELADRLAARTDPAAFAEHIGFRPALHHRHILQNVKSLLVDDETDILILLMPPGSAKSTYGTVTTAAWALARNPAAEILLACNVGELAQRFGRQIRQIVAGDAWQRVVGNSVTLADDSSAAGRWNTSAGGGLFAVGVGAAVLGRRADLAILDDLVASFEVAANPAQLQKIAEWIKSDLLSRMKPNGKIVCIMQRMAYNDPAGFLQRHFSDTSTRVNVITLPMEAEVDDPLGRAPGERLWPEWFTDRHVETAKLDSARWLTMYQQQPLLDVGQFFSPAWIDTRLEQPNAERMSVSLCVDLATGQPGGDYTVIAAVGTFAHQGQKHLFVLDVQRRRISVIEAADLIITMAKRYDASEMVIDDDMLWKSSKDLIADRMRQQNRYVHPHVLKLAGQDKPTRAGALRAMMMSGRVHFADASWLPALENELIAFPLATGNGVDDQVDALALLPEEAWPGRHAD